MRRLAAAGCATALLALAGCAAAPASSASRLQARAEAGDAQAQFELGAAHDAGAGVPANGREAEKWYRRAAEQGHAEAQNAMGSGLQAAHRFDEAARWFGRAAAQGHPSAFNSLAYLHDLGLGVPQDRARAHALYAISAELGWAEGMWNLAIMHGMGQVGGGKDFDAACSWTLRAARFAEPDMHELRVRLQRMVAQLRRDLGAERFARCERSARGWAPAGASARP